MINVQELVITDANDRALIEATMKHPKIYAHISDDSCPARESFHLPAVALMRYLGIFDSEDYMGLFAIQQHNGVTWEVHTCLLPDAWGSRSKAAADAAIQWGWKHLKAERIITQVPKYNRLALRFAKCAGMIQYGLNPRSWKHHGKLWDVFLLGISREEALCQQ